MVRNTMIGGRRQGVMCAFGHGLGFGVYAGLAVFGLIVLLEEALNVFTGLQLVGCGLLAWYGWSMWNANHDALFSEDTGSGAQGLLKGLPSPSSIQKSPVSRGCAGPGPPARHEPDLQNCRWSPRDDH